MIENSSMTETNKKMYGSIQRRRDCISIRNQLFQYINGNDYTMLLNLFLQGKLSKELFDEKIKLILTTPNLRSLHNLLMSSIIFNAHFAVCPPPTMNCVMSHIPDDLKSSESPKKTKINLNGSINQIERHHIPSINQLLSRIKMYIAETDVDSVDIDAAQLIQQSVLSFISLIIHGCIECSRSEFLNDNENNENNNDQNQNNNNDDENPIPLKGSEEPTNINFELILQVIELNPLFTEMIDEGIISKYKSLVQD